MALSPSEVPGRLEWNKPSMPAGSCLLAPAPTCTHAHHFWLQSHMLPRNRKYSHAHHFWLQSHMLPTNPKYSSLLLYRTLQPEYQYAHYLSEVKCFSNRRLLSRFRTGCHGLRVDTGRWENNVHLDRKDRLCLVCSSAQQVEDEHHLFDCPAYSSIRASHANPF